jgi:hypothetical protein
MNTILLIVMFSFIGAPVAITNIAFFGMVNIYGAIS